MLAEVAVALAIPYVLAADVAHLVAAHAGQLVAARGLDEAGIAARARALYGEGHGQLDLGA